MSTRQQPTHTPASFSPLESRRQSEAVIEALGLFALGLAAMGWPFWEVGVGFHIPPFTLDYWFGYLIAFAIGILAALFGLKQLYRLSWLGQPSGAVSQLHDDRHSFAFRFEQYVNRSLEASITASLVLRETITTENSDSKPTVTFRDHLAQAISHGPLRLESGQRIQIENQFSLPERGTAGFYLDDVPLSWVVKVQVTLSNAAQFWHEFLLPFPVTAPEVVRLSEAGYRVRVFKYPGLESAFTPPKPLLEVAPHLDQVMRMPFTVREGVSRDVAEQVCRHLEAAGAVVELSFEGNPVPRTRIHDLPLPVSMVNAGVASLPIVVQSGAGVLPETEI